MGNVFCPKCGNGISADEKFCSRCGAMRPDAAGPATPPQPVRPLQPSPANAYRPPPQYAAGTGAKQPGYAVVLIVISGVLLLAALLFGAWRFFLDKPAIEAVETTAELMTPSAGLTFAEPSPLPGPSEQPDQPETPAPSPSQQEAASDPAALFEQTAFSNLTGDPRLDNVVKRWESPIRVEILGYPAEEDEAAVNAFLVALGERVPEVDIAFLEGAGDEPGNMRISFVPKSEMASAVTGYAEGNWAQYYIQWDETARIINAEIAITTDTTTKEERAYAVQAYIAACLGLTGKNTQNPNSILYGSFNGAQSPQNEDYTMVKLLYSGVVYAGQPREEAVSAVKMLLNQ